VIVARPAAGDRWIVTGADEFDTAAGSRAELVAFARGILREERDARARRRRRVVARRVAAASMVS